MQRKWFPLIVTIELIIAACIYSVSPLYAQKFEFQGKSKRQTIRFIQVKNLIIIPLYINGKGPYNFLLDTGVGQLIITDTTITQGMDLSKAKTLRVVGYGLGEGVDAAMTRNITASIGRSVIKGIPTAVFKTDVFDLSSYLGIKIHGILGYYFYNSFVVRINYGTNQITFYQPESGIKIKGTRLPMKIVNAKPYINAIVDMPGMPNTNIRLLVDNGSSHPLMLESIHNMPFPLPKVTIPANLGVGISGEIEGAMGRIDTLKIMNFTFNHVLSGFPDFSTERTEDEGYQRNGTLGAEVLKHFLVTFDYQNEALYLKKRNKYNANLDHDMSGMEIYNDYNSLPHTENARERYYVGRVEPGSPAEEAGIFTGDQINSINFRNAQSYDLNELTALLKERDGKQLIIEIQRKTERFLVVLTLKRRI